MLIALGRRVQSSEYRVQSTEYRVQSTEYRVQSSEYRVQIDLAHQSTIKTPAVSGGQRDSFSFSRCSVHQVQHGIEQALMRCGIISQILVFGAVGITAAAAEVQHQAGIIAESFSEVDGLILFQT